MTVLQTQRLRLRQIRASDSAFILELLNDPDYIRFIRDCHIRSLQGAEEYINKTYQSSYDRFGFGLYLVELKEGRTPLGICGLIKREVLQEVDLGFAFLQRFWKNGYAIESAMGMLEYALYQLKLTRIAAVTLPTNFPSIKLLEKLGMSFDRMIRLAPDAEELRLYVKDL